MRKFFRRQPSLTSFSIHRSATNKSLRRTSATCLNIRSIQVVRGAYNIDLNKVDASFTKLHKACLLNDDEQVKKHISKVLINSYDASKRYPIHLATVNGNIAILKTLIENGADINVQDNEGHTPLIKSIECGHEHLVKYLLASGADPNVTDLENNTALHWAISTESMIAIDALMSSKKCDLSLHNNRDETCLHLAVRNPLINTTTYESLLLGGSELLAKDQLGLTAIDIAQACNNSIALEAFGRFESKIDDGSQSDSQQPVEPESQVDISANVASIMKLCEDYKQKYIKKTQENLSYEKDIISLKSEIDRLRLDMSCLKEINDKLTEYNSTLTAEISILQEEKSSLKNQVQDVNIPRSGPRQSDKYEETETNHKLESEDADFKIHKEFLSNKMALQERIDQLKGGLTTMRLY